MNIIEQMLTGEMDMPEFIVSLKSDPTLQAALRSLIPIEAVNNRAHSFWRVISYDSLQNSGFDFLKFLEWIARFNGTIEDNLNIWSLINNVYLYHHPKFKPTKKYENAFNLYLSVIKDCFDGPEVNGLINYIIQESLKIKLKKDQLAKAKRDVALAFHTVDAKKPRWIQGPAWPMGVHSPMKFISQRRYGEVVKFFFRDVDTGEPRTVEQFY